jgi:hypothetical protein
MGYMSLPMEDNQTPPEREPGFKPAFTGFFLVAYLLWALFLLGWTVMQPNLGNPFFGPARPYPLNTLLDCLALIILLNAGIVFLAASTLTQSLEWFALFGLGLAAYQMFLGGVEVGLGTLLFSVLALTFALTLPGKDS